MAANVRFLLTLDALKAREDIESLREQYDNSIRDYDLLKDEHKKLQVTASISNFASTCVPLFQNQLAIFNDSETAKDK